MDHFTVVDLVTWPLNGSEAGVDLVLIQTSLLLLCKSSCSKGPGKRGHFVADTLLPLMLLGLRKMGNICIRNIFWCPGHKICVRNKCCARGQTGKHLCRQQCVRNNVSSFARALMLT